MTDMSIALQLETAKRVTVFRDLHNKENPYCMISNKTMHDKNIEKFSDLGLLTYLLSWSNYHRVCIEALAKRGKDGRDAIRNMLKRLESLGYVKRTQLKSQNGQFGEVIYQIFESPDQQKPSLELGDSKAATEQQKEHLENAQLGFDFEMFDQENNMNFDAENDKTANGFSVNGESDTNKYNDSRNTISNSEEQKKIEKQEIINRFPLKIDDPVVKARLNMSMLSNVVSTQAQLDAYLLDFNLNHSQFKNLTPHKRLLNFIVFLNKIHTSKAGQNAHRARLRANGFIDLPAAPTHTPKVKSKQDFSRFTNVQAQASQVKQLDAERLQKIAQQAAIDLEGF
ncbi:hypothetical protein DJ533_00390 (plasmid) [Acinetobacter defluvii]|uniref:Helix-turn-helix domain-containing protein n=1 Tax=Acinetobacter defluvii TaxID=1871111 RepID=A0A2S2F867_9GAMM|nr:hypothetical protein [Acinetobacter defluvii]AWL27176.1 hypothetical protein DJ533_00390 [Acinetobacter defluvii]